MELLGRMPRGLLTTGRNAREFFNRHGELRHIKKLRMWPLQTVLEDKYDIPPNEVGGTQLTVLAMHCLLSPQWLYQAKEGLTSEETLSMLQMRSCVIFSKFASMLHLDVMQIDLTSWISSCANV